MPTSSNNVDVFAQTVGSTGSLSASFNGAYYGMGFDGDVTISSPVTIARNMHYNNLTITGAGRLKPAGFRVCVAGTLTIDAGGSINDDGPANPTPGTSGVALVGRGTYGPAATAGRDGVTVLGNGTAPVSTSVNVSLNNIGTSPIGGAGGASGAGQTGGAGGAVTLPNPAQDWSTNALLLGGRTTLPGAFGGGAGGGSGGCNTTGGTCTSGAGGCGAGAVMVYAKTVANNGRISANGANGGAAAITGTANGGGGGGGGGGLVFLMTASTTSGVVQALAGTGGAGAGTLGVAGNAGVQGCAIVLVAS